MGSSFVVNLVVSQPRGAIPPATLRTMPSKVSFKGVATKVRKAILKSKKKVSLTPQQLKLLRQSHKPPRMSDDEKRIIREQGQEGMEFCAERVEWLRSPLVQTGRYANTAVTLPAPSPGTWSSTVRSTVWPSIRRDSLRPGVSHKHTCQPLAYPISIPH